MHPVRPPRLAKRPPNPPGMLCRPVPGHRSHYFLPRLAAGEDPIRSKDGDAATGLQPVKRLLDDRRLLQTMESFAYGDEVNRLCSNQRLLRPPNAPIDISNSSARGLAAAHLNHLGFKIDRVYMLEAACEVQCHASRPAGQVKKNSRRR